MFRFRRPTAASAQPSAQQVDRPACPPAARLPALRLSTRRGTVLLLVIAVLGLLLILGTAFLTVTQLDRTTTENLVVSQQGDLALKALITAAAESIRRDMFDPSGYLLLTGGVLQEAQSFDRDDPPNGIQDDERVDTLVGEYMDYPDPMVDEWLSATEPEALITNNASLWNRAPSGAPTWANLAIVGEPVLRGFRDPNNRRHVPAVDNVSSNNLFADPFTGNDAPDLVDADNDGVADAIWCYLPMGASIAGLEWRAAVRIVDLSGMINLNTAIRPITREAETQVVTTPITPQEDTLAEFLSRYHTGAQINGFLLEPFLDFVAGGSGSSDRGRYRRALDLSLVGREVGATGGGSTPAYFSAAATPPLQFQKAQTDHLLSVALNPRGNLGRLNSFGLGEEIEFRFRGGIDRPNVQVLGEIQPFNGNFLFDLPGFGSIGPPQPALTWLFNPAQDDQVDDPPDFSRPIVGTPVQRAQELARPTRGSLPNGFNMSTSATRVRTRHLFTGYSAVANLMPGPPLHSIWEYRWGDIPTSGSNRSTYATRIGLPTRFGGAPAFSVHRGLLRGENNNRPLSRITTGTGVAPETGQAFGTVLAPEGTVQSPTDPNGQTAKFAGKSLSVLAQRRATGEVDRGSKKVVLPAANWRIGESAPITAIGSVTPTYPTEAAAAAAGELRRFAPTREELFAARARQYRASIEQLAYRAISNSRNLLRTNTSVAVEAAQVPNPMFGFVDPATTNAYGRFLPNFCFEPADTLSFEDSTTSGVSPNPRQDISINRTQRWWYIKELADIYFVVLDGYLGENDWNNRFTGNYDGRIFLTFPAISDGWSESEWRDALHGTGGTGGARPEAVATPFDTPVSDLQKREAMVDNQALMAAHLAANTIDFLDSDSEPTLFAYVYYNPYSPRTEKRKLLRVVGIEPTPIIQEVSFEPEDPAAPASLLRINVKVYNPWDVEINTTQLSVREWKVPSAILGARSLSNGSLIVQPLPATMLPFATWSGSPGGGIDPAEVNEYFTYGAVLVHEQSQYAWMDAWGRDSVINDAGALRPGSREARTDPTTPGARPSGTTHGSATVFPRDTNADDVLTSQMLLTVPFADATPAGSVVDTLLAASGKQITTSADRASDFAATQLPNPLPGATQSNAYLMPPARWFTVADIGKIPTFGGVYVLPDFSTTPSSYITDEWYNGTASDDIMVKSFNGQTFGPGPWMTNGQATPTTSDDDWLSPAYMYTWADRALQCQLAARAEAASASAQQAEYIRQTVGKVDWLVPNKDATLGTPSGWQDIVDDRVEVVQPASQTVELTGSGEVNRRRSGRAGADAVANIPNVDSNNNTTKAEFRRTAFYDWDLLNPAQRLTMFFSKVDPMTDLANNDKNPQIDVDNATQDVGDGFIDPRAQGGQTNPASTLEGVLYGQININTAPYRVLRYLPWFNGTPPPNPIHNEDLLRDRLARSIIAYRSNAETAADLNVNIPGLSMEPDRRDELESGIDQLSPGSRVRRGFGFLSTAELMNLSEYDGSPVQGEIDLATAVSTDLDYRHGRWTGANNGATAPTPSDIGKDGLQGTLADRDLLFRNVVSMIHTRSDTFCVYGYVQGLDPSGRVVVSKRAYWIVDRTQVRTPYDTPTIYGPYENQ